MQDFENAIFEIITHSGTARGNLYDALNAARNDETEKVNELLDSANSEMVLAHNVQTRLISNNASGKEGISLLLIHAQDQFMTTMSEETLIKELIKMQMEINSLEKK